MKKHFFYFEFIVLFIFFILPPLLTTHFLGSSNIDVISYVDIITYMVGIFVYLQHKNDFFKPFKVESNSFSKKEKIFILFPGIFLLTFGELITTSSIIELTGKFLGTNQATNFFKNLTGIKSYSICLIKFLFSAFYEESMYRVILPMFISQILFSKLAEKQADLIGNFLSILVFAFSHRYLGYLAVLNAACAGIFLRICYKKSGSVYLGTAVHFCYNIINFAFF